jgi:hypothetical protein
MQVADFMQDRPACAHLAMRITDLIVPECKLADCASAISAMGGNSQECDSMHVSVPSCEVAGGMPSPALDALDQAPAPLCAEVA